MKPPFGLKEPLLAWNLNPQVSSEHYLFNRVRPMGTFKQISLVLQANLEVSKSSTKLPKGNTVRSHCQDRNRKNTKCDNLDYLKATY